MRRMLTRSHYPATLLLIAAATLACPSNETFDSLGDTPATTTATTTGASDPATGSSTEPTSSSSSTASTTDASTSTDGTTEASTGTTGEPSNLCPEHATTDACCCFEAHMNIAASVSTVCGNESLCAPAEFACSELDQTCTAVDVKTIDCVLQTLIDDKMVGSLTVAYDIDSGYGSRKIDLYLQGDGSAYVVDKEELDVSGVLKATGRHVLRETAYFEACLAGDVQAKADCLENVLGDKASEVCTEEFNYET